MSAEERLEKLQAALTKRGVKDAKFFFGVVSEKPPSQLASDVAAALEAVTAGKFSLMPALGDSVRTK